MNETVSYKLADIDRVMGFQVTNLSLELGTKQVASAFTQDETKEPPLSQSTKGPTMVRDGKKQAIWSGYRQTGPLFIISNGEVF